MIKIAHRGNFNGANHEMENNPEYLLEAINKGFYIEADIWFNGKFYLGHDEPKYLIDLSFINRISNKAWFHCKNLESLYKFSYMKNVNYFWHQEDDFTLTNNGFIWTYPNKPFTNKSIIVLTKKEKLNKYKNAYGICSDFLI